MCLQRKTSIFQHAWMKYLTKQLIISLAKKKKIPEKATLLKEVMVVVYLVVVVVANAEHVK